VIKNTSELLGGDGGAVRILIAKTNQLIHGLLAGAVDLERLGHGGSDPDRGDEGGHGSKKGQPLSQRHLFEADRPQWSERGLTLVPTQGRQDFRLDLAWVFRLVDPGEVVEEITDDDGPE
jgi:hypothetical protein